MSSYWRPLHRAIEANNIEDVRLLLQCADASKSLLEPAVGGRNALHLTVMCGHLEILKECLKVANINDSSVINSSSNDGSTVLHRAMRRGTTQIIETLLTSASVDVNARDLGGYTPLHRLIIDGASSLDSATINRNIMLLLDAGAEIDAQVKGSQWTPLLFAIERQMHDQVRLLLENGANVNACGSNGSNALHILLCEFEFISSTGWPCCLELLLEYKVNFNARNRGGRTAVEELHRLVDNHSSNDFQGVLIMFESTVQHFFSHKLTELVFTLHCFLQTDSTELNTGVTNDSDEPACLSNCYSFIDDSNILDIVMPMLYT